MASIVLYWSETMGVRKNMMVAYAMWALILAGAATFSSFG